ncbi:MAG: sigma-54-dependent Fis family transcriptional regulator [Calditrichaeota bacterium]|nr:MAG: sigma-54-dependent Fis family transcriptional regulator [Calditrichota bacterium]
MKILIVEDEEIQRVSLQDDLVEAGYETMAVGNPKVALELIRKDSFDVVLTDLKMPGMDGVTLLEHIKKIQPDTTVIMMTAYGTVESAVRAMKLGAYDYLTKPFSTDELLLVLKRVESYRNVLAENVRLKKQLESRYSFGNIIGKSAVMQEVYRQLEVVAPTNTTVLLEGETGTGKEMVANAIHYNSPRKDKPLVKVSCAMLSKEILESELFGHVRGAFTGAIKDKKGRFELADGGSIFLDEVDDIPVELQVKLLRVLEQQEFERVGGTETIKVDVRVIAATKKNLRELVTQGKFREDLFYRLNIYPIRLPPLRERKDDIPLLFEHFLREYTNGNVPEIHPKVMALLMDYSWPGNVRELKNLVERLTLACKCNPIVVECLPLDIRTEVMGQRFTDFQSEESLSLDEQVARFEINQITQALAKSGGNKAKAAQLLGIPTSTLKSKMKKYRLD